MYNSEFYAFIVDGPGGIWTHHFNYSLLQSDPFIREVRRMASCARHGLWPGDSECHHGTGAAWTMSGLVKPVNLMIFKCAYSMDHFKAHELLLLCRQQGMASLFTTRCRYMRLCLENFCTMLISFYADHFLISLDSKGIKDPSQPLYSDQSFCSLQL